MGYSRLLANYPYLVVAVVAIFSLTCFIIVATVGKTPGFPDPKLGFVARGTELSGRIQSYEKLLDETNGMLSTPLNSQYYISAADLGTKRDMEMRNRTQAIIKEQKRQERKRGDANQKSTSGDVIGDVINDVSKPDVAVKNETSNPAHEEPFFCDAPRPEYARYVYQHINESNLFTFKSVRASCELDNQIRALPSFKSSCLLRYDRRSLSKLQRTEDEQVAKRECCRSWSLSNYITLLSNRSSCVEVTENDVVVADRLIKTCIQWHEKGYLQKCASEDFRRRQPAQCKKVPMECIQYNAVDEILRYITDVDYMSKGENDATRNTKLTYAMTFIPLAAGIGSEILYHDIDTKIKLKHDSVEIVAINFGLKDALFDHYLQVDSMLFLGALSTVIFIMWLYTKSIFLTAMAMMSIMISLLISYSLYTTVYDIDFFPYMNLMAIVLLIGIGADDVFLYCRIWYLAKLEKNVGTLEKVISDTLSHAALSMFVTSFTTAAALLANLVSNITALKCFSIFASTTIMVNFAMMLTWVPACIVIHDKWCADCCFCYDPDFRSNKGISYYFCKVPYKIYRTLSEWARIFFEKMLPHFVVRLRYVWLFVLGILGLTGMFIVLYYPKLKLPSTSEFQIFALTHPFEVYDFKIKDRFWFEKAAGASAATIPLTFVWGVKPQDTGSKLDPYSDTELEFDPSFNLATAASQRLFLRMCRELSLNVWYQGSMGPQFTNCFIEPFMNFMERDCRGPMVENRMPCCKVTEFPYPEDLFNQCLNEWVLSVERSKDLYYMNTQAGPRYDKKTGEIVALVVQFNSKQSYSYNFEEINYFYNQMNDWIEGHMGRAPPEFQGGWFVSDLKFYDLQSSLAQGTPVAIGVSIAIATGVAFLTTLNILITFWAMVSISATVFVVVATLVLIGWELNIMEAVTLTVAVGLAMDFTLHYGMGYRLSPDIEREQRVLCSMKRIGSPVAMAALSTFLAGCFVVPSTIQAYRQLGIFLLIVMSVSWLYSTFFFQSLLRCVGPIGGFSQFSWPTFDCCTGQSRERVDKTVYTMSESTFSSVSSSNHAHTSTSESPELEPLTEECEISGCDDSPQINVHSNSVRRHSNNNNHHHHNHSPYSHTIRKHSSTHHEQNNHKQHKGTYKAIPKNSDFLTASLVAKDKKSKHCEHSKIKPFNSSDSLDVFKKLISTKNKNNTSICNANEPSKYLTYNTDTGSLHMLANVGESHTRPKSYCDKSNLKSSTGCEPIWVKRTAIQS